MREYVSPDQERYKQFKHETATDTVDELRERMVGPEQQELFHAVLHEWGMHTYKHGLSSETGSLNSFASVADSLKQIDPEYFESVSANIGIEEIATNIRDELGELRTHNRLAPAHVISLGRFNAAFPEYRTFISFARGTDEDMQFRHALETLKSQDPVRYWETLANLKRVAIFPVEKFDLNDPELLEQGKTLLAELAERGEMRRFVSVAHSFHDLFPDVPLELPDHLEADTVREIEAMRATKTHGIVKPLRVLGDLRAISAH